MRGTERLLEAHRVALSFAVLMLFGGIFSFLYGLVHNAAALKEFRGQNPAWRPPNADSLIYKKILIPLVFSVMLLSISARWILWEVGTGLERSGENPAAESQRMTGTIVTDSPMDRLGIAAIGKNARDYLLEHLKLLDPPSIALHLLFFGT
ncbi:MAG: hypothetical protein ACXVA7_21480, partial [Isosphaeraceae bacterium]